MESGRAAPGAGLSLDARIVAPLADVVAFLRGETSDDLLNDLIWGLIGLDPRDERRRFEVPGGAIIPPALATVRLFVHRVGLSVDTRPGGPRWMVTKDRAAHGTKPAARPFHLLSKGDYRGAIDAAERRLEADGFVPFGRRNRGRGRASVAAEQAIDPTRLLAACLFPLSSGSLTRLARKALPSPPLT